MQRQLLDEKIKPVMARETGCFEVLWIKTLYAVGQGLVVKPIAQKLSTVLPLAC